MSFQPQSDNVMITMDTSVVLSNQSQDFKKIRRAQGFCLKQLQNEDSV